MMLSVLKLLKPTGSPSLTQGVGSALNTSFCRGIVVKDQIIFDEYPMDSEEQKLAKQAQKIENYKRIRGVKQESKEEAALRWDMESAVLLERPPLMSAPPPIWLYNFRQKQGLIYDQIEKIQEAQRTVVKNICMKEFEKTKGQALKTSMSPVEDEPTVEAKKKPGGGPKGKKGGKTKERLSSVMGGDDAGPTNKFNKDEEFMPPELKARLDAEVKTNQRITAKEKKLAAPGCRITEDDLNKNRQSLSRCLSHSLYLLLKDKNTDQWVFPTAENLYPEGIADSAQRAVKEHFGGHAHSVVIGNAPLGVFKNWYSQEQRDSKFAVGSKVFFYRALLNLEDKLTINADQFSDYAWVSKEELHEYFPSPYLERVRRMLWSPFVVAATRARWDNKKI